MSIGTIGWVGLLVCAGSASAGLVVVEPDAFAAGTNISTAFAGVILSQSSYEGGATPTLPGVFSVANNYASTGALVFGTPYQFPGEWGTNRPNLRADFSSPASSVSVDLIGNSLFAAYGFLDAFRANGTRIQRIWGSGVPNGAVETLTVNSAANEIKYVILGGQSGYTVLADNLRVTLVPLPSSAGLAMAGVVLVNGRRRRSTVQRSS